MSEPKRIQLRRTKGWRKPEGAIVVARPGYWGNPFKVGDLITPDTFGWAEVAPTWAPWSTSPPVGWQDFAVTDRAHAVALFRDWCTWYVVGSWSFEHQVRTRLPGYDLCCWCPLEDDNGNRVPCHADVLLELANPQVVFPWSR